jgi:arabinogalactan oligomer/maltooligosaccharide transport system substrate-binding protein
MSTKKIIKYVDLDPVHLQKLLYISYKAIQNLICVALYSDHCLRRNSVKKVLLVSVLLLLVGVVGVRAQDAVSLTYWDTMNDQERVVMQEIIDSCEATAGVDVTYEYVPFSEAQANFRTAAQAGNAPDILRSEIAWGPEYAALGYLVDLTDWVSEEERAGYLAAPLNYNTWGGRLWGLPQVTDAPALIYNKALFEQAGLDPAAPPTTMEELRAAAEAIAALGTEDAPIYGIATLWDVYPFQAFMWAYGGDLITINEDGTYTIGVNTQGTYDAFAFVQGLLADGLMGPEYDPANQYGNSMTAFKEGRAGMIVMGPWATADILSGPAFEDPANMGVAAVPAGPDGLQGSPVGGHEYVIYAGSANAEAALELVRCLNSVENQVRLATDLNLVPTLAAAYEDPVLAENDILQGFLAQMQVARNRPVLVAGGQIYTEFGPQYTAVILGERTPEEAMAAVEAAWQQLLENEPPMPGM